MKYFTRSSVNHYAIAAVLPAVATVLAVWLGRSIEPSGPEIFLAAVMLAAWYGGLGPGLLATALSVLAIDQFLMPAAYRSVLGWDDVVRLLLFVLVSVLISWLNAARKQAKETLQLSNEELEERVWQRTAELARTNAILQEQVAERLQAEKALRESEEQRIQLEREQAANRAKDECLAMVSHDLRTPLNSVLGWIELIRRRSADEALLGRGLDAIERSAKSQQQLLADLLDFSRMKAGSLRLALKLIEIPALVEAAIDMVRPDADNRSIGIHLYQNPSISQIAGDAERLRQVVLNLLANALKFTPPGGSVEVRIEQCESTVRIVVTDTGCGIPSDSLPFVFDRFYQGRDGIPGAGLGLGLSIARRLVEMHGGTIGAYSDGPGRGATFTVELPMTAVGAATGI